MKVKEFNLSRFKSKYVSLTEKLVIEQLFNGFYRPNKESLVQYTFESNSENDIPLLNTMISLSELGWSNFAKVQNFPSRSTDVDDLSDGKTLYVFQDEFGLRLLFIKQCTYEKLTHHQVKRNPDSNISDMHYESKYTFSIIATKGYLKYFLKDHLDLIDNLALCE